MLERQNEVGATPSCWGDSCTVAPGTMVQLPSQQPSPCGAVVPAAPCRQDACTTTYPATERLITVAPMHQVMHFGNILRH
jgi:hypothetical protein